jgi:predicted transcriptional regulator
MTKKSTSVKSSTAVKTAISVDPNLFGRGEELARKLKISRSRLYSVALESLLQKHRSQDLTAAINAAYADEGEEVDSEFRQVAARNVFRDVAAEETEPW